MDMLTLSTKLLKLKYPSTAVSWWLLRCSKINTVFVSGRFFLVWTRIKSAYEPLTVSAFKKHEEISLSGVSMAKYACREFFRICLITLGQDWFDVIGNAETLVWTSTVYINILFKHQSQDWSKDRL